MFQRFASALFGDDEDDVSRLDRPGQSEEDEEEHDDWILVDYLGECLDTHTHLYWCLYTRLPWVHKGHGAVNHQQVTPFIYTITVILY